MTPLSKEYPKKLKEMEPIHQRDIPNILYYRGIIDLNKSKIVAIVGARDASSYALKTSYKFAYELAKEGFTIISGMARGVDTYAHKGALDAGGNTIAVLGNGLDIAYPSSNERLMKDIIKNGMVISEYPIGTLPLKHHFPKRNRIISMLSDFVLVIEAKERSGSLITARLALDYGMDVGCIPGNINSEFCKGSNSLLQEGAFLILDAKDIIELFRR